MNDESNKYQDVIKSPSPYAGELMEQLSDELSFHGYPPKKRLYTEVNNQKQCYFIRKGIVEFINGRSERLLNVSQAPCISVNVLAAQKTDFFIRTFTECEIAQISHEKLYNIIASKGIWELYTHFLQYKINLLYEHTLHLSKPTAYAILRSQLYELMKEPDVVRESTTVERYVRDKTHLSRSGVLGILAQLKTGGYIVLDKGILKEIKNLPEKY